MSKKESTLPKPSVGLIGLGIIGSRIATLLRRAEYPLFVWNRSPRPEPYFLASATAVAEAADIILLFVRDGTALLEVLREISPTLTAKHLIVNHATVSPQQTLEASEIVARRGASFLEAPFTGSRDAAAEAKLVYYIGGSAETLARVRPLLETSSQKILPMGPIGAATYIKIATNLILGTQIEVLAEALEFLRMGGIPLQHLAKALEHSAGRSGAIDMKLPQMLRGDFEPRFSTKNMLKDLQFALTIAKEHAISLPATEATAASLQSTVESGLGDADYAAVATHYPYPGNHELFSLAEATLLSGSIKAKQEAPPKKKKSFFSFLRN